MFLCMNVHCNRVLFPSSVLYQRGFCASVLMPQFSPKQSHCFFHSSVLMLQFSPKQSLRSFNSSVLMLQFSPKQSHCFFHSSVLMPQFSPKQSHCFFHLCKLTSNFCQSVWLALCFFTKPVKYSWGKLIMSLSILAFVWTFFLFLLFKTSMTQYFGVSFLFILLN